MVKQRKRELMLLGCLVALGAGWWLLSGGSAAPSAPTAPAPAARRTAFGAGGSGSEPLPRIDLDRLQRPRRPAEAGQRSLFDFAQPPAPPPPPPPTEAERAAADAARAALVAQQEREAEIRAAAPPPGPPPLNVRFIGALESKPGGLKVAVLMTDRKEILTGQPGETVANRLKIVAIGIESVDVQDVGSERVRRIPLKGN
jgi:hypothetical protein